MTTARLYRIIFLFSTIAALIALFASLAAPSESKSAVVFGLSASRLALSGLIIILGIGLGGITVLSYVKKDWLNSSIESMEKSLSISNRSAYIFLALLFAMLVCLVALVTALGVFDLHIGMLTVALQRATPLVALLFTVCALLLWGIAIFRGQHTIVGRIWEPVIVARFSLFAGLVCLTFIHWLTLIFQIPWFSGLKGWYFYYNPQVTGREWFYILIFLVLAVIGYSVIFKLPKKWSILALITAAMFVQIGLAWVDQGNFENVRVSYIDRYSQYAKYIGNYPNLSISSLIRDYDTRFRKSNFIGTKPPGLISLYILVNNIFSQTQDPDLRLKQFSAFLSIVLPILAALAVVPIWRFSDLFLDFENKALPALLFILTPAFGLVTVMFDQALYPALSILFVLLWIKAIRDRSILKAFMSGILLYLLIFLSFSFLPLSFFAFLLLVFHFLIFERLKSWRDGLKPSILLGLAFLAGWLLLYFVFYAFLNYDVLIRYVNAMAIHRSIKQYPGGLSELPTTILINNSDFALGIGPALWILSLVGTVYIILSPEQKLKWLAWSLLLTFIVLNLVGQTRSETARLWIYLIPFFSLFATNLLLKWYGRWAVYTLILTQLLTTFLILSYQGIY
jgi:hypothetical protein